MVEIPMSNGSNELVHVPFHGDDILVLDVDGKPHIVLKPVLDVIGLDYWSQVEKLRKRSWAAPSNRLVQLPGQQQRREMIVVDVRTFLMLLATIDENRVAADVKTRLVTYQAEVADVIEAYWTRGGAVNPRATADQLEELERKIKRGKAVAEVIEIYRRAGIGDLGHWDAAARRNLAQLMGEAPEFDPQTKPLTVSTYLEAKGVGGAAIKKVAPLFGKALKKRYIAIYGEAPPQIEDLVGRHMVSVAQYQEQHRPLFDEVWAEFGG
jgi:hypothetical protein